MLPFAVADSLMARNIRPTFFALKGACDPAQVRRFRHHWISIGQLGRLTSLLRTENCRDLVFIGSLVRPALSEIRLDWGTIRVIRSVWAAFRGGDDHLLTGIAGIFERDGFRTSRRRHYVMNRVEVRADMVVGDHQVAGRQRLHPVLGRADSFRKLGPALVQE